MRCRARRGVQLELVFRTWGGLRNGAGRPPSGARRVGHGPRERHSRHVPVHVTMRVVNGLPSLRRAGIFGCIKRAIRQANFESSRRAGFRITHFSVQGNHMHLIAEAVDTGALSRGMQGFSVRVARRVNKQLGRRGRFFADRYHSRQLRTPREVRNALAYVLLNERKHLAERGLSLPPWYYDACSSALEFDGWRPVYGLDPPRIVREVTAAAKTYLLAVLWKRCGLIAPDEVPCGS